MFPVAPRFPSAYRLRREKSNSNLGQTPSPCQQSSRPVDHGSPDTVPGFWQAFSEW